MCKHFLQLPNIVVGNCCHFQYLDISMAKNVWASKLSLKRKFRKIILKLAKESAANKNV